MSPASRDVTLDKDWKSGTSAAVYMEMADMAARLQDQVVYFSHYEDERVYRVREGDEPKVLRPGT